MGHDLLLGGLQGRLSDGEHLDLRQLLADGLANEVGNVEVVTCLDELLDLVRLALRELRRQGLRGHDGVYPMVYYMRPSATGSTCSLEVHWTGPLHPGT